jgi:hypothetical protein
MLKSLVSGLAAFLILLVGGSAVGVGVLAATMPEPQWPLPEGAIVLPREETTKYLVIAARYSRYTVPLFKRPRAVILPDEAFQMKVCGPFYVFRNCGIVGAYFPSEPNTIYIRQHVEIDADETHQILVHELTHWLQEYSGWESDFESCPDVAAREAEAYTVEYLYSVIEQKTKHGYHMPVEYYQCEAPQ